MKLTYLATATAAVALLGGAAYAQQPQPEKGPTPGSVTGDWNGAHSPTDDKQYQEKVTVPVGSATTTSSDVAAPASDADASASTSTVGATASTDVTASSAAASGANASFTNMTVTNGPVPDTRENRAKYGQPMSRAGKMTAARGN
jgi:sulfite reductase alpha subunit-like flavoprotein